LHACAIVVIALNGGTNLEECLNALIAQDAPCIVMLGPGMATANWQGRFPSIRFVDADASPVPMRRMRGIHIADTELIALLEDSSVPGPDWFAAIRSAFESDAVAAVGGPVTIADNIGHRQQALGCCEFGRFHPALVRGLAHSGGGSARSFAVDHLPGNNVAYRRSAIDEIAESRDALIETVVNAGLRAAGYLLIIDVAMVVEYRSRGSHGARWIDRYRHGRLYGGNQAAGKSPGHRGLCFFRALLLPMVLSGRSLRRMTLAIPVRAWCKVGALVCWMETAWALGEAVGAVAGTGDSLEEWNG
jgi:GT2 family glycosyltransferase